MMEKRAWEIDTDVLVACFILQLQLPTDAKASVSSKHESCLKISLKGQRDKGESFEFFSLFQVIYKLNYNLKQFYNCMKLRWCILSSCN